MTDTNQRRAAMDEFEFRRRIREERRTDRICANAFVSACKGCDPVLLLQAADQVSEYSVTGWTIAIRKISREIKAPVHLHIQSAFTGIWVEHKHLALAVGDDKALLTALHMILPAYSGPPLKLFRGTTARERRRRCYGISWTASLEIAEKFAQQHRTVGDAVLIETVAPPKAILCDVTAAGGPYDESEYLVDRRYLTAVKLLRRYKGVMQL